MPFGIPNEGAAAYQDQAEPDSVDFGVLVAGFVQTGTILGCAVTAGTGFSVSVSAGVAVINGRVVTVAAQANQALTTADATNPRFDLVTLNTSGVVSIVAGSPSAAPIFPTVPASRVVLAAVFVPANDTAVDANQIVDKRVVVSAARARKVSVSAAVDSSYAAVVVGSDSAPIELTLPLTDTVPGHVFLFKRVGTNNVTLFRSGTNTFEGGATSKILEDDGAAIGLMSVGDGTYYITGTKGTVT